MSDNIYIEFADGSFLASLDPMPLFPEEEALYDGQPRKADGRFDFGKMAKASVQDLPMGWREMSRGQKVQRIKTTLETAGYGNKAIGEIEISSSGLRHSINNFSGPLKECLLINPAAMKKLLWSSKCEMMPNAPDKPFVSDTFGLTGSAQIDGTIYKVQCIIHRHNIDMKNYLYHVRLIQKK